MAPLISMIVEAAEELRAWEQQDKAAQGAASETGLDALAINGAANWDLCTLAVFTCSQACTAASGSLGLHSSFDEELAVLVNEDACHLDGAVVEE